jgi:SNF2 family DNA or RNA helicase
MRREGPFYLPSPSNPILVPTEVFELLKLGERGPSAATLESHLEFIAAVQRLAQACDADVDKFLSTQDVVVPEAVGVVPEEVAIDRITLTPRLELPQGVALDPAALASETTPRVLSVRRRDGKTSRVVFSSGVRDALGQLRQRAEIRDADVPRFIENPEAFLPPGLDLSDFSKRVVGFRTVVYNSRPYLHLRPSQGGWFEGIPGIEIEPSRDGAGIEHKSRTLSQDEYRQLLTEAKKTGDEYVKVGDGWVRADHKALEQLQALTDKGEVVRPGVFRLPAKAILEIYQNLDELEFELPPAEAVGLTRHLSEYPDPPIPAAFKGELLPHQRAGFRWLAHLHDKGAGGLLADDMGLGKTVQVISHLARLSEMGEIAPSLIVCPKTIIDNWVREMARFLAGEEMFVYDGKSVTAETLRRKNVVITSYDTLRSRQLELAKVDWRCVVCDEAQYAKNPTAQRTSAVKALKSHHRIALTGTPVENGLIEFWCILDFVRPGHLASWSEFRDTFERPLVNVSDESARRPLVNELLDALHPHYLRRMKEEILTDLPAKTEREIAVPLGELQFKRYREVAAAAKQGSRGDKLAGITRLLMVCAHPLAVEEEFTALSYVPGDCPKLDATLELLAEIRSRGEKALVFTRFLAVQRILQEAILSQFDIWPATINGALTRNRQQTVDHFQRQPSFNVLILSHDVGGIGLNITSANHVIHYTRPWNPAKENQATDRAHRIGQTKPVTVYHPIATDERFITVERRLAHLLKTKQSLARDVLRPTKELAASAHEMLECLNVPARRANALPMAIG